MGTQISSIDALWSLLIPYQNTPLQTTKGLSFTYTIKGNELFVSRKKKSITRATVKLAYERAVALGDATTGPKKLGVFGASYLYPVFVRLGVIPVAKGVRECGEKDENDIRE